MVGTAHLEEMMNASTGTEGTDMVARQQEDSSVDLRDLARTLWAGRRQIVVIGAVSLAASVLYAFLATEIFRSQILLQPRDDQQLKGGIGSLIGQLGSVADLAGISLGDSSDRDVAVAALTSRAVIERFLQDEHVLPRLYESDWDATARKWKASDPDDVPTVWKAYEDFTDDVLVVSDDKVSGLVTVAIEWKDPREAQHWASEIVARTNAYLREKAIREAEGNLAYLQGELRSIGQVEVQQGAYMLIEGELKKLMIAKGNEEFALKVVDPAVVATERNRPKRLLVIAFGTLFGLILGGIWIFIRKSWSTP